MASPQPSAPATHPPAVHAAAVHAAAVHPPEVRELRPGATAPPPALSVAETRTATYATRGLRASVGLTSAGVVAVGAILVGAGAAIDLATGRGPGAGLATTFLLACALMALRLPTRLVATAVIAAPLLFAAAIVALAWVAGDADGLRRLTLDVTTSLALSAPVLFGGTALAVLIGLGRLCLHLFRRTR